MRRRSYSNQAFFSGLLRFTFDRNTCFGSISEQSSSLRQSHLLQISSQLMSPFARLLAQVLSNIKSSSNKENKLRTMKIFWYLLTLDVCKTSCLRSAVTRLQENWDKLSQNLSQNSRKVTRTGRQPRTFNNLHSCTEQSNQVPISVCLLTSGPVWIRLALTMST